MAGDHGVDVKGAAPSPARRGAPLTPVSPAEAVSGIASGERVFIGTGPAEPESLVQAMTARAGALRDVHVVHSLTMGAARGHGSSPTAFGPTGPWSS